MVNYTTANCAQLLLWRGFCGNCCVFEVNGVIAAFGSLRAGGCQGGVAASRGW